MSNLTKLTFVTVLTLTLISGCAWDNRDTGTAVGAVAGGVAGNLIGGGGVAGTAIGAVGGAVVGNQLSK